MDALGPAHRQLQTGHFHSAKPSRDGAVAHTQRPALFIVCAHRGLGRSLPNMLHYFQSGSESAAAAAPAACSSNLHPNTNGGFCPPPLMSAGNYSAQANLFIQSGEISGRGQSLWVLLADLIIQSVSGEIMTYFTLGIRRRADFRSAQTRPRFMSLTGRVALITYTVRESLQLSVRPSRRQPACRTVGLYSARKSPPLWSIKHLSEL